MHIVPGFGHDEEIFSLAKAIAECLLEHITDHILVAVAGSAVEHTVTGFDGTVNSIGNLISCETVRTEGSHTDAGNYLSIV